MLVLGPSAGGGRNVYYFQKHMVFIWKYKEFRNLSYHGTGSEEGAREAMHKQQSGGSLLEQCYKGNGKYIQRKAHAQPNAIQT